MVNQPLQFCQMLGKGRSNFLQFWEDGDNGWLPAAFEILDPSSKHLSREMPGCRLSEMFRDGDLELRLSVNKQLQILVWKGGPTPPSSSKSQS